MYLFIPDFTMRVLIISLLVAVASAASLAPIYKARDPVENSYLVKIKDDQNIDQFVKKLPALRMSVTKRYKSFNGIAITALPEYISMLQHMPEVEYIEQDGIYKTSVEWGCDRIDQRNLPLDGAMNIYGDGSGAHVYIIDTGLRHTHQEYQGRASYFWDFDVANGGDDCNGHGTHCGGTAAGISVGIATSASLYSVRVLNCIGAGTTANIVAGCDAVTDGGTQPGVASMSLGGGESLAMDSAVERMIAAGYTVSIAAGNDDALACNTSPARVEAALTVGATESNDQRAPYSNFGGCVDIFAPGSDVRSSYNTDDSAYAVLSGTSMACPHVTGVAAVHLGAGTCSNNAACRNKILADATTGVVGNPGIGSPNLLLYCA
ncbi:aqualysin-1-like [Saccoglossus kowalevskii]|uniref:Proprotein convertase subtilisin/kexin type 9-related161 n=2 Tax=Saccoglossus kowalevskii TaxID=10224 RepID=A0A0U2M0Z8_SACKO|nr:proprotein convertase subtilisin/kexin type 9-related161 [Saccoglossus kowalevskii]